MKLLKKPIVALLLSAFAIIAATLFSVEAKLDKEMQAVTDGFYEGVTYSGYQHPSIYSQLSNIIGAADGMCAIAKNNGADCSALSEAASDLKSNLSTMHEYISSIYWSYEQLCSALSDFTPTINEMGLDARDSEGMTAYLDTIKSAQRVIDDSGYNQSVRTYKSSMGPLAEFFTDVCGLYGPEYFAR